MKRLTILLLSAWTLVICSCSSSKNAFEETDDGPRIGLVLGGGGAKAAAEIGVLKWIDENNIPISYIAGSSMGAVVGGLYASGYSAKEIEAMWLGEDWLTLFKTSAIGKRNGKRNAIGLIPGNEFEIQLRQKVNGKKFGETKIPFCCTATRIKNDESLDTVIIERDDLSRGIRASMTFPAPGVYKPIEHLGMTLADGGMINNLPIDLLKDKKINGRKLDLIIVVDLEVDEDDPLLSSIPKAIAKKLRKIPGVDVILDVTKTTWLANWLESRPDIEKHKKNVYLAETDESMVYLHPNLKGFNIGSFKNEAANRMILNGMDAAIQNQQKILNLFNK